MNTEETNEEEFAKACANFAEYLKNHPDIPYVGFYRNESGKVEVRLEVIMQYEKQ